MRLRAHFFFTKHHWNYIFRKWNYIMTKEIWTVKRIIEWGKNYLQDKQIDSPRLTMELLLCEVMKLRRIDLYLHHDKPLNNDELKLLRAYILRRADREPLQYIIGHTEFYGHQFIVNPSVLIPRPETELLVQYASEFAKKIKGDNHTALDIGTGSGCIIISFSKMFPQWKCTAIDISDKALATAERNAEALEVENIAFHNADVFEKPPQKRYSLIMSNPPYIAPEDMEKLEPEVAKYEPRTALTDDENGLKYYSYYATLFPKIIRPGGAFFLEIGYGQSESIQELFTKNSIQTTIEHDYAGIPRILWGIIK